MKYQYMIFIAAAICLSACKNEKITTIEKDGFTVKAESDLNSFFDGKTKWYKSDTLRSIRNYSKGILNGAFINYYANGKVYDSVFYTNGVLTGYRFVYNEKGKLRYKEYNYYGKKLGPQFYYDDSGMITDYMFNDFENKRVFEILYKNGEKDSVIGEIINYIPYSSSAEGFVGLFIFPLEPPRVSISYYVVVNETATQKNDTLFQLNNKRIFIDTLLPVLEKGKYYQIRARVFDSSAQKEKIYINEAVF